MPISLLTHPTSLALLTTSKTSQIDASSRTPLVLPSRFPSGSKPLTSVSPSTAHVYLYSPSASFVWEYDSKGRRTSEIPFPAGAGVVGVVALGKREKETVVVALANGEVKVMEKGEKEKVWACVNTLQGPEGTMHTVIANRDANLVVCASESELVVYDQKNGSRVLVPLLKRLSGPIPPNIAFSPTLPSTLLVPSGAKLLVIALPDTMHPSPSIREIQPFSDDSPSEIVHFTCQPSAEGSKKGGGLCAVLRRQVGKREQVALVGLDSESTGKLVSFGDGNVDCLAFLDGATLAAGTLEGTVLVKDLRALGKDPVDFTVDQPVIGIQTLPTIAKAPRASSASAASAASTRRVSVLSEARNHGNIDTPPSVPVRKGSPSSSVQVLGRAKVNPDRKPVKEAPEQVPTLDAREKTKKVIWNDAPSSGQRAVSAPASETKHRQSAPTPLPPAIIEEEEGEEAAGGMQTDGIDLGWALQPFGRETLQALHQASPDEGQRGMEEMRREIANLQLDMLRMGRGLKNEIRRAVGPLMSELRENKEVIERQRKEIERLRRGY
ncbi:hypothetical protein P7C73_g889, partial [Tremellales sp. Uapishka_1]